MPVLPRWASIHGVAGLFLGVLTGCGDDGTGLPTGLEACGSPPFLTVSPLAFGDIHEIAPLGNLNPPGHVFPTDHIYFYTSGFIGSGTRSVPLVSPSDVVTTEVTVNRRTANLAPSFAARVGTLGGSCDPPVGTIHCYETGIPPGQRRILLMLVSQTRIRVQDRAVAPAAIRPRGRSARAWPNSSARREPVGLASGTRHCSARSALRPAATGAILVFRQVNVLDR